ncbi:UNVERIFIED_CONTAM: O-fucosyltransferase 15 [Sesamum radiatum]|uniref:O-fucosyltransferase family protein n=1 Tax=Sesamum radiatum TaxID=300843 RepID=A0AAW2KGF7_SESRA
MNSWMLSRIQEAGGARGYIKVKFLKANSSTVFIREELQKLGRWKKPQKTRYARLLAKAAHAMAEGESKPEPKDLWVEPYISASSGPLVLMHVTGNLVHVKTIFFFPISEGKTGYIMVTANGGINQQRVAVCNAVAVARLLNATLVLPKFMYSSVWRDARVVHFVGFGNRLASDPIPSQLQRLRCRCNFHALRFVPKIQEAGALLIQRMRQNDTGLGHLDNYLVGPFAQSQEKGQRVRATKTSRYLALHLRFEIDMVAHSLCEFGGGEEEMRELEAYRKSISLRWWN